MKHPEQNQHGLAGLPGFARVFDGPGVWMEGNATDQIASVAALPGCLRVAGMPDLHAGRDFPIGAVVATQDVVYPLLVGGDAGCGARIVVTNEDHVSPDKLERRIRRAWEESIFEDVEPSRLFDAAWSQGPAGLLEVDGVPEALRRLAALDTTDDALPPSGDPSRFRAGFEGALGSIGGGNHFAEISKVSHVVDSEAGKTIGLEKNSLVALVHSGSRGLGAALFRAWCARPLVGAEIGAYLGELAGACRFARTNRLVVAYRLLSALSALRAGAIRGSFDVTHNDVRAELVSGAPAWIHRKGAAPAYESAFTVVLGSRGAPSWVMKGNGEEASLRSVAHGAGRRMGRTEAREKVRARYHRAELSRSPGGGRVICDDKDLLFEEHPDAYKAIEPIICALEANRLATRVASLVPVVTVKL
ncbi:hypothetical protein AKJ09_00342 [Labilithrix luteola]|uniref:tRNA-splicing ligase RtcB n=1 Tax=Labilithrix luteola TaxID=1391654 RepID=A0A0K1PJF4_9BACT|nr:RtcB family protein [Labilithrix luteola]AKU93678.1 hypothetical protein AKJ09_00342 [Labilithrix luteola]